MATLFQLPKVTGLPGSKLYFFLTGTSTPQNVFTDVDLSVAHSQPVEADAAGVFAPIYMDGTLDDYRVAHYTSDDVLIYQVDGVPSGGVSSVVDLEVSEKNNPFLKIVQRQASANNKKWLIQVASEQFKISTLNDAESSSGDSITIDRSNTATTGINFGGSLVTWGNRELHVGKHKAKNTITSISSEDTLADDAELVIAVQAGTYDIEGLLYFYATTTAGMGFKFDIAFSGTGGLARSVLTQNYVNGSGTVVATPLASLPISHATISTNVLAPDVVRFNVPLTATTAGNVSVRWAQASSTANNLNLLSASWLKATYVT
jgi:hypothetical protein